MGSANYGPWATSSPRPIFANKVLLKHAFVYILSIAAFPLQWGRVVTEAIAATKPNVVTN